MSLKEDVAAVKEEIGNEEKFLSAFVKTEKFVKKYKTAMLSVAAVAVVSLVGYIGYGYYEDARMASANDAYLKLMKNSNDKDAAETLKQKSKPLFEAYTLQVALKNNDKKLLETSVASQNKIVADISSYELALASGDIAKLSSYASNKDSFYKDLALFVLANKYIEKKEYQKARESLNKIGASSELKEYANYLFHSIVTLK
jgi:hypothetical protein